MLNRPTVPEAAEALKAYYALPGRDMGGCVHVITEDANVSQLIAEACALGAREWGDKWGGGFIEEDERIAQMLANMSVSQRRRLARMSFYP